MSSRAVPLMIPFSLVAIGAADGEINNLSNVTSTTDTAPTEGITLTGRNLPILVGENLGVLTVLPVDKLGNALSAVTELVIVC
mgnify:CR=1 FL=1